MSKGTVTVFWNKFTFGWQIEVHTPTELKITDLQFGSFSETAVMYHVRKMFDKDEWDIKLDLNRDR